MEGVPLDADSTWALRELGPPDSISLTNHPFAQNLTYAEWSYPGLQVLIAPGGSVVSMNVWSARFKTRRGIGVGSRAEEVLAAYGPADSGAGPDEVWEYNDPKRELHFLQFRMAGGRVVQVSFGYFLD